MAGSIEIKVPDIGGFKDVNVIDVLVRGGQQIDKETPLITIETDKAAMDVPSPRAGKVVDIQVKQGDKVSEGSVILTLEAGNGADGEAAAGGGSAGGGEVAGAGVDAGNRAGQGSAGSQGAGTGEGDDDMSDVRRAGGSAAAARDPEGRATGGESNPPVDEEDRPRQAPSGGAQGRPRLDRQGESARTPGEERRDAPRRAASAGSGMGGVASNAGAASSKGAPPPPVSVDERAFSEAYASPSVRQFARELGADLGKVRGTGTKGRITADDVKAHVKALLGAPPPPPQVSPLPKVPVVDFGQWGAIELEPLSRIQKISGARLQASWLNLPHVTQHEDADITDLEALRGELKEKAAKEGVKLTPLAFIVKACIAALREHPRFNASLDAGGDNLVLKKYFNIGFAADTPNGLVVPVIANANRLTLFGVAQTLAELSEKARAGKLKAGEMQGGSFTISSLGGIGGTAFTPIINAPEVAILGVSRAAYKPVYKDGAFVPRLMLPLSLSYDHRVIDGAAAARFAVFLAKLLADPKALM